MEVAGFGNSCGDTRLQHGGSTRLPVAQVSYPAALGAEQFAAASGSPVLSGFLALAWPEELRMGRRCIATEFGG